MRRVFASQYGITAGHVLGRAPWSIPATLKILFDGGSVQCVMKELYDVTCDGRLWSFDSGIFRLLHREGSPDSLEPVPTESKSLRLTGPNWMTTNSEIVLFDEVKSLRLSTPLPDMRRSEEYNETWLTDLDDTDMRQFVQAFVYAGSLILGRWGMFTSAILYPWESVRYKALKTAIDATDKKSPEYGALLRRLREIEATDKKILHLENAEGLYAVEFYDCFPATFSAKATPGGVWRDGDSLYACGEMTAGAARVVPTLFDSDGTCLGVSFLHSGCVQCGEEGYVVPIHGGMIHVGKRPGVSPLGDLLPCGGTWTKRIWTEESSASYPILADAFVSTLWGHVSEPILLLANPPKYLAGMRPVSGVVAPVTYGGTGETIWGWVAPAGSTLSDMAGPLLKAVGPSGDENYVTNIGTFQRSVLPGKMKDVVTVENGARLVSYRIDGDRARRITSPIPLTCDGERFTQEIKESDILMPWRAYAGEALEIGWWNWPEIDVYGGWPNPAGLGDATGSNDFTGMNIGTNRRCITATSDGYLYFTFQKLSPEAVGVASFRYEIGGWKKSASQWTVPDVRVAPYGQGCYSVYHYPGTNWSLFFAPCCDVQYRRFWEPTDWSWMLGLVGLAGGDSLYGAYMVQQAFQKYMDESFGNLMLIYSNPYHRIMSGDIGFNNVIEVSAPTSGGFWSFVGWTTARGEPEAVFSRAIAAGGTKPTVSVWCVGRYGKSEVDPAGIGAIGLAALETIPANYYPRIGLWPGTPAWQQEFLGGSDYYYFDLPEGSGSVGSTLAETVVERLKAWQGKEADVRKNEIMSGQVSNHALFSTAVIDPLVPVTDARLMTRDGQTWALLRHETGVWIGVRCNGGEFEKHPCERDTEWELVSLGLRDDGSIIALFGNGVCSFEIGDYDGALSIFGFGRWWERYSVYKWYARVVPIVIEIDSSGMAELGRLWGKKKE